MSSVCDVVVAAVAAFVAVVVVAGVVEFLNAAEDFVVLVGSLALTSLVEQAKIGCILCCLEHLLINLFEFEHYSSLEEADEVCAGCWLDLGDDLEDDLEENDLVNNLEEDDLEVDLDDDLEEDALEDDLEENDLEVELEDDPQE